MSWLFSKRAPAGLVLAFLAAHVARGAESYRFTAISEGAYPSTIEGRAIVDKNRSRIELDVRPTDVVDLTTIISTPEGQLLAINDLEKTWFSLSSRARLSINNSLFSYGNVSSVTALDVKAVPLGDHAAANWRLRFSYKIATKVGGERVRGRVWGYMLIWTIPEVRTLPWRPLDLRTELASVDQAMAVALRDVAGTVWQTETEVSRQLENGAVLTSVIRRSVGDFAQITAPDEAFNIPAGYVFREPQLGVPAPTGSEKQ